MKLPLPEARERLSWTWIPREINKVNATYDEAHNTIRIPLETFWGLVDKIPGHYLGYYDFESKTLEIGNFVMIGDEHMQNQMDIYSYENPPDYTL